MALSWDYRLQCAVKVSLSPREISLSRLSHGVNWSRLTVTYHCKQRLSLLPIGLPDVVEILPARPHDVNYLAELVDSGGAIYLGDKGFICEAEIKRLEKQDEKLVVTPNRSNHRGAGNTDLENMLLSVWRNKIEAVFSILTAMRIKNTGAKTMTGLIQRVYGIVLAFSVGVYINVVHGRYPLEVIQLFS